MTERARRSEEIEVGDEVYCVDPDTGEHIAARVSRITRAMRECGRLHMADGSALMLTSCHPIFDPESGEYAPAGDWMTGQRTQLLASASRDTEQVRVTQVEVFAALSEVFDLTVDHQYGSMSREPMRPSSSPSHPST